MVYKWGLLFVGLVLAAAEAKDYNQKADQFITKMNSLVKDYMSKWYTLPGFSVEFDKAGDLWWVHQGAMTSSDDIKRNGRVRVVRKGNDFNLTIPVIMNNMHTSYQFGCYEAGTYEGDFEIATTLNAKASIVVKLPIDSTTSCKGEVGDVKVEQPSTSTCRNLKFNTDDTAKVSGSCPAQKSSSDYLASFQQHFCQDHPESMSMLMYNLAQFVAQSGFDFC